ncbi:MAG: hypothetical protein AB7L09_21440 [Nitrospira sp.]
MAMVQNHFEINVSKYGKHCFATAERSAVTIDEAYKLFKDFEKRFPKDEGYKIEITKIMCSGVTFDGWQ